MTNYVYAVLDENNIVKQLLITDTEKQLLSNEKFIGVYTANTTPIGTYQYIWTSSIIPFISNKKFVEGTGFIDKPSRILTKWQFKKLFTFEEQVAIKNLSLTDVTVAVIQDNFNIAEEINLDDPDLSLNLDVLVEKNILSSARKLEILA